MPSAIPSISLLPTLATPNALQLVIKFTDVKLSDLDESQQTALKAGIESGIRKGYAPLTLGNMVVNLVSTIIGTTRKNRRLEEGPVEGEVTFTIPLETSDAESEEKLAQASAAVSEDTGYAATVEIEESQSPSEIPSGK